MKNMGKKHGTTFIEIILALSIIGIISLAVFNNIFFSIRQNTLADNKQKNSIIGQMAYEEIKNLSDEKFKEMLSSLKPDTETENEIEFDFLGNKFENVIVAANKEAFKDDGEETNEFKLYREIQSDIYVKISFPNLDFKKKGMGLDINYEIKGSTDDAYSDWMKESDCDVSFIIEKQNGDNFYKVTIKRKGVKPDKVIPNLEANDVISEIVYENKSLSIEKRGKTSFPQTVSGENANIYINNTTDKTFNFKLKNKNDDVFMKIYLNQKSGENEKGKIQFSSYGEKIQIFSNDSNVNPYAEHVKTSNVCKYKVSIYNMKNGTMENMPEIIGYKKFKRFGE